MVSLPAGKFRLIDNRIVVGESSWAVQQPATICVLHPKQNTDEHRALVKALLDEVNEARAYREEGLT
jgi:hypothetical protein